MSVSVNSEDTFCPLASSLVEEAIILVLDLLPRSIQQVIKLAKIIEKHEQFCQGFPSWSVV